MQQSIVGGISHVTEWCDFGESSERGLSNQWNDRLRHAAKDPEWRNDEWGSQATLVTITLNNTLRELKCSVSMAARENVPNTLCQNVFGTKLPHF